MKIEKIDPGTTTVVNALLLSLALVPIAQAQILPDNSLPNNTQVTPNGSIFQIDGGTAVGSNLFHSFQEFSVPMGAEAFFNNATNINNILTRVTGGDISNIDGLIRANGGANLFFINPNGIVFGPNARLDIGGDFIGSTANSIELSDSSFYSAIAANAPSLLTINVPVGLQFGENGGDIEVRGAGLDLTAGDLGNDQTGLAVGPGKTLALVGGDVLLDRARLSAPGGRIELGSARSGSVRLYPREDRWDLDYQDVSKFEDVQLSRQTLIDASGDGESSIEVWGRNLSLRNGSIISISNRGLQSAGTISAIASESLEIVGTSPNGRTSSGLFTETEGAGKAGDIFVSARRLSIQDGGAITTTNSSSQIRNAIEIEASESIELIGVSLLNNIGTDKSQISSQATRSGNAGNINLSTARLTILDGAGIFSSTIGNGNGGNIIANISESVELLGAFNSSRFNLLAGSSLSASNLNSGDAGTIVVNTSRLSVRDGAIIRVSTIGPGNAGNLILNASQFVAVSGSGLVAGMSIPSSIESAANIPEPRLQSLLDLPPIPSGESGSVTINTPHLRVGEGARVTVENEGSGNAGELSVNANSIFLDNGSRLEASTASGEGGNLNLDVRDALTVRHGSQISTEAQGMGNGGNLTVNTNTLTLLENSNMTANAVEGLGGNITITTSGLFVSPDSNITASSQFGVSGTVTVNNPDLDPSSGLIELSIETIDLTQLIATGCVASQGNYFIITGRGGLAEDPTATIRGSTVWRDWQDYSTPTAGSSLKPQDSVRFVVGEVRNAQTNTPRMLVEANAWIVRPDGTIELVALAGKPQPQVGALNCVGEQANSSPSPI